MLSYKSNPFSYFPGERPKTHYNPAKMEYIRQRRPAREALSQLNATKRRKNNDNSSTSIELSPSCSALAETGSCKNCLGNTEYLNILKQTLADVFQQNQALHRRSGELEITIHELNANFAGKQAKIEALKRLIKQNIN